MAFKCAGERGKVEKQVRSERESERHGLIYDHTSISDVATPRRASLEPFSVVRCCTRAQKP